MSITQNPPLKQGTDWQGALKNLITNPQDLLARLDIPLDSLPWQVDLNFPLRVTPHFVSRMTPKDPNDPLLKQVLSTKEESLLTQGFEKDPLQESRFNPIPGVLHKFQNRILITLTQSCAIHCRYCFRRHFPYDNNRIGKSHWPHIQQYLNQHPEVQEVILSGGDPFMASDAVLSEFIKFLEAIPTLKILRIHTRLPVVIPERITSTWIELCKQTRFQVVMVYHINHPQEICEEIALGVRQLKATGCLVLNQSVLLKDINDNLETLKLLCESLFDIGILPYYVHLLDTVQGSQPFNVTLEKAKSIEKALRQTVSGYLMPKFVKEIPGALAKVPLEEVL